MGTHLVVAASIPAEPVLGLMVAGVIIAVFGHMAKSQRSAAIGIALVFLATALLVLGAYLSFDSDDQDPRPGRDPDKQQFPDF